MALIQTIILTIGIIGNVTCLALYLSPIPTFKGIIKAKDTGQFSAFTYVCTLLKCLLWTFYGLPVVTNNNITIATMNAIGIAFEMGYVLIYLMYAPHREKVRIAAMEVASFVLVIVIATCAMTVVPKSQRSLVVGVLCVVLNVLMYAAPLSVLKQVIQSKSASSMPFLVSLFTLVNSVIWLVYGVLKMDIFVIIPNGMGVFLGIIQLIVYGMYRKGPQTTAKVDTNESNKDAAKHQNGLKQTDSHCELTLTHDMNVV